MTWTQDELWAFREYLRSIPEQSELVAELIKRVEVDMAQMDHEEGSVPE